MSAVQFVADRSQLTLLELADLDPAPAVRGADDGRVHELQHRSLATRVGNDLRAATRSVALIGQLEVFGLASCVGA